jgi:glucans biosynthesis protein C
LSTVAAAHAAPALAVAAPPERLLFIDNIRWTMIVLVLSMHACVTYSPFGGWYYREHPPASFAEMVVFATYQSVLQAFFMSLLFFVAGYFAAASCDRKGEAHFVRDRLFRLGLPTLVFMLTIGPATEYFLSRSWGGGGFAHQWLRHAANGQFLGGTGPMWFCAALLGFSLVYAGFRLAGRREARIELRDDRRGDLVIVGFIAAMGLASFAVRLGFREGEAVLNMQLGYFPQYILAFAAGPLAYRGAWLTRLPDRLCWRWGLAAVLVGALLFAALIVFGGALQGRTASYGGGLNWVSAGKCLWESTVCVGASLALIAGFRRFFNRQGAVARWMSANAFAVYFIHPPILVGIALLLRGVMLDPLVKAAVLTALAALACFLFVGPLLRRAPMVKAIV